MNTFVLDSVSVNIAWLQKTVNFLNILCNENQGALSISLGESSLVNEN